MSKRESQPVRAGHPHVAAAAAAGDPAGLGRRDFLGRTVGATAGAALLGGPAAAPASAAPGSTSGSPVKTQSGRVVGVPAALDGITVYKGIPYAASTAGQNRWRPPQPPPSWTGVRTADTWGAACPSRSPASPPTRCPR